MHGLFILMHDLMSCMHASTEIMLRAYSRAYNMLNKNTWGVKKAGPIRSNIANRQAQPKGLISAEAKKLLYQIFVTP